MKKRLLLTTTLLLGTTSAYAGPGLFLGVSYNFGGSFGVSLKVLSTNREHRGAVAAGVSYFPSTRKFGADAGVGYLFNNGAVTGGWDFLNSTPTFGLGFVNTKSRDTVVPPPAAPVVPPPAPPAPPVGSGGA